MSRMPENRIPRATHETIVEEKRPLGRPRKTCDEGLKEAFDKRDWNGGGGSSWYWTRINE